MTYENGFRPANGSATRLSPGTAHTQPAWAESLSALSLAEARTQAKNYQQKACRDRGEWTPAPLPEAWLARARVVGLFAARADWDEPAHFTLPSHLQTAYPLLNGQDLEFRLAHASELEPDARYKIPAPAEDAPPALPDLLLVPCLFMDRHGRRIGRGAGFYDRFLTRYPRIPTLGVLHSDYLFQRLPESWLHGGDRPLSAVVTESSFLEFQTRRNST